MRRILMTTLERTAAERPAGYLQDCLRLGKVEGSFLLLEDEACDWLRDRYSPRGLGDVVASVAQPIARAIDRVAGPRLAGCGACKRRQEALNRLTR